jgi:hypothetical protein
MTPHSAGARSSQTTTKLDLVRHNLRVVKQLHPWLDRTDLRALRELTMALRLSVSRGEVLLIDGKWYVTHAGLLRIALRQRCCGIRTVLQERQSDPTTGRWVFKATVYKRPASKGFVGYGDADPSNVSSLVHGAEMRVAETRAVNRALRKAYGIGLCSVEELGWTPRSNGSGSFDQRKPPMNGNNPHQNGQPRLRDRLCLLIRQYKLDAGLVKAYAADFCNTPTLREASKEQIEAFINDLSQRAANDLPGLICQLNSYARGLAQRATLSNRSNQASDS